MILPRSVLQSCLNEFKGFHENWPSDLTLEQGTVTMDQFQRKLRAWMQYEMHKNAIRIEVRIRKLLTEPRGGGVARMQDILNTLIQAKSLRAKMTLLKSVLSSKLSTIIEELFTVLEENITFFEDLYTMFFVDDIDMQGPTEHHSVAYAVVVSAVALLCLVYQYLIGYVDRGGSKADSSGSLEFRDIYISIVLFLGSYIWIKSRDVAPIPKSAIQEHATHRRDGVITVKYEPRFKPQKENNVNFNRVSLGKYHTRIEAEVVFRTAASCYEYWKDYGPQVDLGNGRFFTIPPLREDELRLSGMEKVEMVKARAKRVYEAFLVWNSPLTLPGAEMPQQLLLPSIQVGEGNALLQGPGHQTQNLGMMQDISMQLFPAQRIVQTPQLPCQDMSHVPQRIVEELTRQNLQLQQDFQRLHFQMQQMAQRQEQVEQVVQRQELQLQQQTRKLKIDRALRTRRGSTCKKSGTQGSARKFSGLPELLPNLVPGSSSVPNFQLQAQNPESTHLQQRNNELMPSSFRPDGVLEHPEEAMRQMMLTQKFPPPEQDQNPESTHLQQRNEELMRDRVTGPDNLQLWDWQMEYLPRLEQDAPCVNGGMSDEEPHIDGDVSDNLG